MFNADIKLGQQVYSSTYPIPVSMINTIIYKEKENMNGRQMSDLEHDFLQDEPQAEARDSDILLLGLHRSNYTDT